jgi:small subunit ribosomal protein S6
MRIYEELYIAKPDATDEDLDALNGQLEAVIKQSGGKVDKLDKWGVRKLAYRVKKQAEGFYVLLSFHAGANTVKELERRLRVSDLVLKFLTVRMDEKLKWLEKRQKARAKRAARKPAPAPPSSALTANAPVPGAPVFPALPALPAEPAAPMPGAPGASAPAAPAAPVAAMPSAPAPPVAEAEADAPASTSPEAPKE